MIDADTIRRILVIRLSAMGDVLLTFSAVDALRQTYPAAHITFLTDPRFASLATGCAGVDTVWSLPKRRMAKGSPADLLHGAHVLADVKEARFDLVVDLHGYGETAFLAAMTGAPMRVGRQVKGVVAPIFYTHNLQEPFSDDYVARQHQHLLRWAGVVPSSAELPLRVTPTAEASREASAWIASPAGPRGSGWHGRLVGFFLGASKPEKRWPIASFAAVARWLSREENCGVVLFDGPAEGPLNAELLRLIGSDRVWLTPMFRPLPLAAALQTLRLDAWLSNDTGPMHLAVASGTKVVALYREATPMFQPPAPHVCLQPAVAGQPIETIAVETVCQALSSFLL